MQTEKPFLNPTLKINDLADSLSIPSKNLSQVINQEFGNNFFDFVNKYRVEEAKLKIINSNGNGRTILDILFDSGFNSKAAFNRAFKKHTGYTPSQFKNQQETVTV
jgi:AraC-like DNA-binding protein